LRRDTAAEQNGFSLFLKVCSNGAEVMLSSRLFQIREAAVGNALSDGGQPSWRYDQCRRRRRSQSLLWTDVSYTSKFFTEIGLFRRQLMQSAVGH